MYAAPYVHESGIRGFVWRAEIRVMKEILPVKHSAGKLDISSFAQTWEKKVWYLWLGCVPAHAIEQAQKRWIGFFRCMKVTVAFWGGVEGNEEKSLYPLISTVFVYILFGSYSSLKNRISPQKILVLAARQRLDLNPSATYVYRISLLPPHYYSCQSEHVWE